MGQEISQDGKVVIRLSGSGKKKTGEPEENKKSDLGPLVNLLKAIQKELAITKLKGMGMNVGIKCDGCSDQNFYGYRYKCLICENFDFCGQCFEERKTAKDHELGHPFLLIETPIIDKEKEKGLADIIKKNKLKDALKDTTHETKCAACKQDPLMGIRYKCDDCYDYDLCQKCFEEGKTSGDHIKTHSLLAIFYPIMQSFKKEDYKLVSEPMGKGCFGCVYKAELKGHSELICCKEITLTNDPDDKLNLTSFLQEVTLSQELKSNYIVKYYGYSIEPGLDSKGVRLMLFME